MPDSSKHDWRHLFKEHLASARVSILHQVLASENSSLNVDSTSRILISNVDTAEILLHWYTDETHEPAHPPPSITIAQELAESSDLASRGRHLQSVAQVRSIEDLTEGDFTHAILHIHTDRGESDVLRLLHRIHDSLTPGGALVLSRRKRDGVAGILHAAGIRVPGRPDANANTSEPDKTLPNLALKAGFDRERILELEKSHLATGKDAEDLLSALQSALALSLGNCKNGSHWEAEFDAATVREMGEHGGLLLLASVIIVRK